MKQLLKRSLFYFSHDRVGVVCVYLNNENTSTAINGISSTGKDTLDDIKVFVNNTVDVSNVCDL